MDGAAFDRAAAQENTANWLFNLWANSYNNQSYKNRFEHVFDREINEAKAIIGSNGDTVKFGKVADKITIAIPGGQTFDLSQAQIEAGTLVMANGTRQPASLANLTSHMTKEKSGAFTQVLMAFFEQNDGATIELSVGGQNIRLKTALYSWTPLMIDMDGDGLALTSDSVIERNGHRTSWVEANSDDLFVVIDRGTDDNGQAQVELLGENTQGSMGSNGFTQLSDYDSNGDGVFNASDDAYNNGAIKTWHDVDGDGVVDDGELKTLSDSHVKSINLGFGYQEGHVNGNLVPFHSTVTLNDDTVRNIYDVLFNRED